MTMWQSAKGIARMCIITGVVLAGFGLIFMLQSASVVGPESSFMYANPEWNINGMVIIVSGIILLASGLVIRHRN